MDYVIACALFLPLLGFFGLVSASRIISRQVTAIIACSTVGISFFCFAFFLYHFQQKQMVAETITLFNWFSLEGIHADMTIRIDSLTLLMSLIITGVGTLIHIYSIGYIEHEKDFARYFACMNFFIFAMLLLVAAGDLLLLFVGWESVGLASYLLIGYWYDRPSAAKAATKAFVVNRIGDLGFLMGILLTFQLFGTGDIAEISRRAAGQFAVGAPVMLALALLYFAGAVGKSAQLPLHVWLPDAMEGPTPVSALIHAATMVTAGVYLLVRMKAILILAPIAMQIVAVTGAVTALFAALCALAQTDLKRVLAYSTVSQLGLMFLACGLGAFYTAMFHLTAHAFVKALLFLSAGNVVHKMHGITDMSKMGGLVKVFTKTHVFFLLGVLALAGVPPLATFFSKDLILEDAELTGHMILFWIGLAASLLTGVYMVRAYCLTFLGKLTENRSVKEAPVIMLGPIAILALLSVGGGLLGYTFGGITPLQNLLRQIGVSSVEKELLSHLFTLVTWAMIGAILIALATTAFVYTQYRENLGKPWIILRKAFFFDEIYRYVIVLPTKSVARGIAYFLEPHIFEASIDSAGERTVSIATWLQKIQSGQIRSYVAWMLTGIVFLIGYFMMGL